MIGDGEIGTGIKSDRERGRIKGIMKGRSKERSSFRRRDIGHGRREPQKPSDRQPGTGGDSAIE